LKALQRIAFSPVVREAGDLACALFDRRGRMVAQANTGTPGHINSLAIAGSHLVRMFANNLRPGDVVTTNDPWLSAGHFFDITVLTPIFDGDRILAYIGSTIHHTDIGGYGIGAGARDVHEEGLWIPPLKLYNAGEPCPVLHAMIKSNVRTPDAVFGDLAAQVSSGQAASERLIAMCERYGLVDIEELSDEIISRSEAATRAAISKLKAGTFHGESSFDVPGGQVISLKSAVFPQLLRREGAHPCRFQLPDSGQRPDAAVHQCWDEPVQGLLPRPGKARLHPRRDQPEMRACRRQAQRPGKRRLHRTPPHLLRDAG
jgi:N-methylhydantoinase B/oxoprolinase/acetone carboxylase alpha subunit